jgi:hypothetical protein
MQAEDMQKPKAIVTRDEKMNPTLAVFVGSKDKSTDQIKKIHEISPQDYAKYSRAAARVRQYSHDQQLFTIVRKNYASFENFVRLRLQQFERETLQTGGFGPASGNRIERDYADFNRHVLNFLSSVRMFLDQYENNLARRFGKGSANHARYEKALSEAWERHFGYRFLY